MRRIFWGFCRNWFLMSPLHYLSGHSDFGFEFAEIFVFEKWLPSITDTGSRRLPVLLSRGVDDSPHHWYAESATLRIIDRKSRLLNFFKENSLYRWYGESSTPPHQWYCESATPRIIESQRRRVDDSAYCWVGESTTPRIGDTGSRYSKKKNLFSFDFQYFKRLKHAFKGSICQKISQGCNVLSQ
jgi:hypothetical protein